MQYKIDVKKDFSKVAAFHIRCSKHSHHEKTWSSQVYCMTSHCMVDERRIHHGYGTRAGRALRPAISRHTIPVLWCIWEYTRFYQSVLLRQWDVTHSILPLQWMTWHGRANVLFAADSEGTVWMCKVPAGDCKTYSNVWVAATCCHLLPNNTELVAAYSNGVIKLWDLMSATCKVTISGSLCLSPSTLQLILRIQYPSLQLTGLM